MGMQVNGNGITKFSFEYYFINKKAENAKNDVTLPP
jgi:hypothetical protein